MTEKEIITKIKDRFSEGRWQHIMGVYETAVKLAAVFGVDPNKTGIAALLHDYGKVLDSNQLLDKARAYGITLEEADYECPELLHGPVGAKMVKEELGIDDPDILQSIATHTLGKEKMSKLDKIIFLADMVEPNRHYPEVEDLRKVVYSDLDWGLLMGFDHTISYVIMTGRIVHPQTIKSRNALLKSIHKKEL